MTTGNGIRGRSSRQELLVGSGTTLNKTFRKTVDLEIVNRTVGSSVRIGKMSNRVLWRSGPPQKRKKSILTTLE
jgi:hypothetical protein